MTNYRNNDDLIQWIKQLERRIEDLAKANPLNNSTIDEGGLIVKGGGIASNYPSGRLGTFFGYMPQRLPGYDRFPYDETAQGFGVLMDDPIPTYLFAAAYDPVKGERTVRLGVSAGNWTYPYKFLTEFTAEARRIYMQSGSGGYLFNAGPDSGIGTGCSVYIGVTPGYIELLGERTRIAHYTTSNAANTHITVDGEIWRSTSSKRYKTNITLADLSEDASLLLELEPVEWTDKQDLKDDPETEDRYHGYLAEDLHELGLSNYVVYNEEGQPEAIEYEKLVVPLIELVKNMNARLLALEYPQEEVEDAS